MLAAPEDFEVTGKTVDSISVRWTPAGGDEKHYRVNCFVETHEVPSDSVNGTDDNPEATCEGLKRCTEYTVEIETVKPGFVMERCESVCRLIEVTGS